MLPVGLENPSRRNKTLLGIRRNHRQLQEMLGGGLRTCQTPEGWSTPVWGFPPALSQVWRAPSPTSPSHEGRPGGHGGGFGVEQEEEVTEISWEG